MALRKQSRDGAMRKWVVVLGLLLLLGIGLESLWLVYSPEHWLRRVDFGEVSVDGRQVPADIYFGDPNSSEAESVVIVHVPTDGDYFLDFGNEKVRTGDPSEYVHLFGGLWCYRPMSEGIFSEPLAPRNLNEFRIKSPKGHLVVMQF